MAAAKKTTAKKTTAKNASFEVTLELVRVTKNTYRFETDEDGAAINPLYIQQSAFATPLKEGATVTVTVVPE